ncbi:hypothetical protein D3C76_1238850 [compost metagenome]
MKLEAGSSGVTFSWWRSLDSRTIGEFGDGRIEGAYLGPAVLDDRAECAAKQHDDDREENLAPRDGGGGHSRGKPGWRVNRCEWQDRGCTGKGKGRFERGLGLPGSDHEKGRGESARPSTSAAVVVKAGLLAAQTDNGPFRARHGEVPFRSGDDGRDPKFARV